MVMRKPPTAMMPRRMREVWKSHFMIVLMVGVEDYVVVVVGVVGHG